MSPLRRPEYHDSLPDDKTGELASRREFLLVGASLFGLLLTGCAGQQRTASAIPGPVWRPRDPAPRYVPPHRPTTPVVTPEPASPALAGVLPRSQWASAQPIPTRMNRMTPIHAITVHHDGMSAFGATDERSTISRLESIRRFHRDNRGWGDIGYHYIIDRAGRTWEGRPITYQGAHVSNHNEGNIGVMLLGNFDQQSPSPRQLEALNANLSLLMRTHRLSLSNVTTHREWESARTACPGTALQTHMDAVRRRGLIG